MKKKIVLTGGHAGTTALAVIEEIIRQSKDWDIFWIGSSKALEGSGVPTLEARTFPRLGVAFHPIVAGRLQKRWTIHTIPAAVKIPLGFIHAPLILSKIKPDIVLSFGGYSAVPVVIAAWLKRIPIIVHEQITGLGLANRISAPFARKVALARKEGKKHVSAKKAVLCGNPVMASVGQVKPKNKMGDPPVVFITGGSRGAQNINKIVDYALADLLEDFIVIHQTGELDSDYFNEKAKKLQKDFPDRYQVASFFEPEDMADVYRQADIIISRAGANTVSEIMVTGRPAVLIPIPWTKYDEQNKNALAAEKCGLAMVMDQDKLAPKELIEAVQKIKKNWHKMVSNMDRKLSKLDLAAASKLVGIVEGLIK